MIDLSSDCGETVAGEAPRPVDYDHRGSVDHECDRCHRYSTTPFSFTSKRPAPTRSDYENLLTAIEVEHSLDGCNGSVYLRSASASSSLSRRGEVVVGSKVTVKEGA